MVNSHDERNHEQGTVAPEVRSRETDTTLHFTQEFAAQLAAMSGDIPLEEQEAIAALPAGSALLVVKRGPNAGARFLLDADVTSVGRHSNSDIFLDDVTVSRRHTEFVRRDGTFILRDLGSLNGTYFEGTRVDEAVLADRSEVQIGKFRLTFYASRVDLINQASQ